MLLTGKIFLQLLLLRINTKTCDIKGQEKIIKNTLTEMNLDAKSDNRLEDVTVIFIIFSFKMLYFRHVKNLAF
ncbi:TPA: hypothetical protein VB744_001254 [Streptococcus pyogenes]|uniref:Uncharacterized protein n=2 Tax=Streptococcus pyogenes TaxID=1314 RepID=A0A0H2UU23_STRP3|nr:hypothetical protein SpyM3_0654 [Streptococcus pyogenes MGAS315]AIG47473.1 hypothetical protein STAB902_06530 [Streptococcus pyogenes STAB902]AKZ52034.1 hypothetical protein SD90_03710 [Streptococcus pyogenes]WDT96251.1 hypothetical protein C9Q_03930 [Streptococcus pyogenes MGAS10870]HEP6167844.1 hypothetical protein [Streptococcus pyogenes ABC020047934]HEP6169619.1 hypothetical protein [Streptococcus pyogenes ABC020030174]HEP6171342.1 hypothetical protein [Streptococcus pyogenes ABC020055